MKKKSMKGMIKNIVIILLILICIIEGAVLKVFVFDGSDGVASTAKLKEIKALIDRYYLEDVDEDQLEAYTYKGLLAGLGDPYSTYYTKEEVLQQDADDGTIKVVRVIKDSPAEEAGVKANDILYKIEGKKISSDEDLSEVVSRVKGKEGTNVNLTFLRNEEEMDFTITRKQIENPTVEYEMLDQSIGYIQITEFEEVTVDQFENAMEELEKDGMEKLVLDLRDNPGGLLSSVVSIADQFIGEGMIVYTEDKNGNREEYTADSKEAFDQPLAVLINGNSASASEILAGAIQDYKIGTLVGTTSFGKGIVQSTIKLPDGSALKLTISSYYTPEGRNIHEKGIDPDVEVELDESLEDQSSIKKSEDNQLQKAIEVLENEK